MGSMLGNSNSDYPLFRLQKKVDFYETIGGQHSITNFIHFFQILLLNGPKTFHLLQFSQRFSLIRPLLYNRQSADQSTFVLLNRWDA